MERWSNVIPEQHSGGKTDISAEIEYNSSSDARIRYNSVKGKLGDVNNWGEMFRVRKTTFALYDANGIRTNETIRNGQYIRIDHIRPKLSVGDGYDWVYIVDVLEASSNDGDLFCIQVNPSSSPLENKSKVAHYLDPMAISILKAERIGMILSVGEHTRNENPNLGTGCFKDNIRNCLIEVIGAFGISFRNWHNLLHGSKKI